MEITGIESVKSLLVVRHADHLAKKAVYFNFQGIKQKLKQFKFEQITSHEYGFKNIDMKDFYLK